MIIWMAAIIPVVTLIYLLVFYRKELVWPEVAALVGIPVIIIGIVKVSAEYSQTRDTEFWGGWVTDTRFYEDWNEYVHRTCTRQNCSGSGDSRTCTTETYDCSYVHYHPEFWEVNGSNGERVGIGRDRFEFLCKQFDNKVFVDMKRNYHTNDGDMYMGKWKGEADRLEPITSQHTWENRVQASRSVFRFPEVKDRSGIYDYPAISEGYRQQVVLGATKQLDGVKRMEYWNAVLGARKKVRIYTLLYRNLPLQKALDQQSLWMGGNKNELNVAVGLDNEDRVQWAHVFSWSEIEGLKVEAKNYVIGQSTFSLVGFADWLGPEVNKRWVKKNFHDFDYLRVDPPLWAVILAFILSLISSGIAAYVSVTNSKRSNQ